MSIHDIFPDAEFSQTEEDIVIQAFSHSSVKKYLRRMALADTKELLEMSAVKLDKEAIARLHSTVQGKLQVVGTLLAIGEESQTVIQSGNSTKS
jgi:hypothetical protein